MSTEADRKFVRTGGRTLFKGRIVEVVEDTFLYPDGREEPREIIRHPGAVGVLVHDGTHIWLTRQPREAINEPNSLEIPAGRLDKPGEDPLAAGKRELAEEIGRGAKEWQKIVALQPSVGILEETVHIYCAWDLFQAEADSGEVERIEIVRWPISEIDQAISVVTDSKTLVALLWAKAYGLPGAD